MRKRGHNLDFPKIYIFYVFVFEFMSNFLRLIYSKIGDIKRPLCYDKYNIDLFFAIKGRKALSIWQIIIKDQQVQRLV